MMNRLKHMALMILLLLAGRLAAQDPVPALDSVCSGAVRHYRVDGEMGSTYSWILKLPAGTTVLLPSDADTVEIEWNYPAGTYQLASVQHSLNGCSADTVFGPVIIFDQPDVYAGPDDLVCSGHYYKLTGSTASSYSSVNWTTSGDGIFDDISILHPVYYPGINDILAGTVTLTITGNGFGLSDACIPDVSSMLLSIVVEIVPQFDSIGSLCVNSVPPILPDTSLEGITGYWVPPTISTSTPGTFTFTFTPDDPDQCGVETSMEIEVVSQIVPLFDPIGPLCVNSTPPVLPDTSLNGITGTWSPAWISTDSPGTFSYTFTPDDPGQCGAVTSMQIIILPELSPTFDPIGPLCQYSTPPALPDTSVNGISGTWDPPVINTTLPGISIYTFVPDDLTQCAIGTTMEIAVASQITPVFDTIGPLCQYSTPPVLPGISLNGITGTWDPPIINTSVTGTNSYLFTPDDTTQCGAATTIEITVTTQISPEFDPIGPLCQNSVPPALPGTSINGIAGTWEPPFISTLVPGQFFFTFTPDTGQCAVDTAISVEIDSLAVPLFTQIGPLNQNSTAPLLPSISLNGFTGTWDPPFIDTTVPGTYSYFFTPDPGQCATTTYMEVTVLFDYLQAITGAGSHCLSGGALVPLDVDNFKSVAVFQLKLSYNVDKLFCEGYINPNPQLADSIRGVIDQVGGIITISWKGVSQVTFAGLTTVCELMFTPKQAGQGQLVWYTGPTDSYFLDDLGRSIPAEFFTQDLFIYEPPAIILDASENVCIGDTVTIYGTATTTYPPLTYQWTYPDGSVHTDNPYLPDISPANAGDYVLLVTDSLGCTDQKSIRIIVNDNPIADFHGSNTLTVQPGYILDAGIGMAAYDWNTGESTESISVDSTGLYWVKMETNAGCTGADSIFIFISGEVPEGCILVPNAFTPNGDGLNDMFRAYSNCPELADFRMLIFDRWGQKIYETDDVTHGWDGTKNGNPVTGDMYVYKITYKFPHISGDQEQVKVGNILLLR
jgi:gliding motility-associated-like protein